MAGNFKIARPRKIITENAALYCNGTAEFQFGEGKYDENSALIDLKSVSLSKTIKVKVEKSENILNDNNIHEINLIFFDAEGTEVNVLRSLNFDKSWSKYIL